MALVGKTANIISIPPSPIEATPKPEWASTASCISIPPSPIEAYLELVSSPETGLFQFLPVRLKRGATRKDGHGVQDFNSSQSD